MALRLQQYADYSPDIGWPRDGTHYVVMSGSVQVGSIIQNKGGPMDGSWTWTITCLVPHAPAWDGLEASKEDAQAAFASAWRGWLTRAGLVEVEPEPAVSQFAN